MYYAIQDPVTMLYFNINAPVIFNEWHKKCNTLITRKKRKTVEDTLSKAIDYLMEAIQKPNIGCATKEIYKNQLTLIERSVIVEVDIQAPKQHDFDFSGSKKARWVAAMSNRRKCGICGGTIFKDVAYICVEAGLSSVGICPFCIVASYKTALEQIEKLPEEVQKAFEEGRTTEAFVSSL